MSYNSAIPVSTDPTLQSSQQIRANFQTINSAFANNHISLPTNLTGMHRVITARPQSGDPATSTTQVALYNKLVAGIPELFFRPSNNQTPIQLTYPSLSTEATPGSQYTFVAGPFVIYGGFIPAATNGQLVTLTPTTTLIYVGLVSTNIPIAPVITMSIPTNITGSSFNISFDSAIPKLDVFYLAIGKP